MARALKQVDVLEVSKLFEEEFNKPDLHDRVLIFDVVVPRSFASVNAEDDEAEGPVNEAQTESEDSKKEEAQILEATVQTESKLSNEEGNLHSAVPTDDTTTNQEESFSIEKENEKEVTNDHETVQNKDEETNQNVTSGNKMKDHDESQVVNDKTDVNHDPNDKGQSESYSENERNKESSYSSSEEQVIRQHKFYIHSAWLAVQSSYFRSLFFSGMKESSAKEVHVQILANEEQAHLMLLEAIYKIDTLDSASVDELLEVLTLAHKYDVKFVFKKCKYVLQDMVDSLEICEKIMCFIKVENTITDVEDLVSILQSFLAKEFSPLDKTWQTTSFKDLCEPSLKYLLSSDELVTVSENTVFQALMYWIEERGIENVVESREIPSLLSVVRFELIPVDYLYNVVQHHSVAKKLPDFNDHYLRGISFHALSATMKQRSPHQSVKRKDETQPFVAYTWVIPTHKLSEAAKLPEPWFRQSDETLKSEEFWYCGYKMILVISNIVKTENLRKKHSVFTATLSLEICNLNEQSEVSIKWEPTSECFMSKTVEQTHVFVKKASSSSVDVKYKIEFQQKETTQADTSLNQTGFTERGFNFGPSTTQTGFTFVPPKSNSSQTFGESGLFGTQKPYLRRAPTNSNYPFGTPASVTSEPSFSFGRSSTNPVGESQSNSASEQENPDCPDSPSVYIDVKMKLV